MIMNMTSKFQMVLPNDLATELRALADRQGVPLAQLIRETMEQRLRESRSTQTKPGILSRLKGLGAGIRDSDLSTNVDRYLYGQDDN